MSFIGIITSSRNEEYMCDVLSHILPSEHIIFIKNNNIENIKNIRFETIIIDKMIKDVKILKNMVLNSKYIILNSDVIRKLDVLENIDLTIITYGFNNKSTFSVSSVSENNIIISMQRIIKNKFGYNYEPEELEMEKPENVDIYAIICVNILGLIYRNLEVTNK